MAKVSVLSPADLSPRLPSSRAKVRGASSSEVCDVDKPRACVLSGGAGLGDPSAQHPIRSTPHPRPAPPQPPGPVRPFCLLFFHRVNSRIGNHELAGWALAIPDAPGVGGRA